MQTQNAEVITYVIIICVIVFSFLAVTLILFTTLFQKRKLKQQTEVIMLKENFARELLQTQLEIQEQTLKTISQEIHDNIGQVLSLTKLNLNTIDINNKDELQEKIKDSKDLVSKAIHDLRDLSKSLNTDTIAAMGLQRAIEYELEMIRKTGFETALEITGETIRMEPQKELILFRIVQETLNNIIKHAEAKKITVTMNYTPDTMEMKIKDNGRGVDLSPLNAGTDGGFGLGIRNMHNRAKLIGADFNMSSSIGNGTTVSLIVPLNNHNL
jgi:two-component system, NarL family, sensor kinase